MLFGHPYDTCITTHLEKSQERKLHNATNLFFHTLSKSLVGLMTTKKTIPTAFAPIDHLELPVSLMSMLLDSGRKLVYLERIKPAAFLRRRC